VLCVVLTWYFVKWNFANVIASRLDPQPPEARVIADGLVSAAPSDPQTHFAAAAVYELTFDPADLARSVSEYEKAAALSPNDYQMWLSLGRARSASGDVDGARAAYVRALELAPNYAAVQWAYGNFLVRQDNAAEGFPLIVKAATSNPDYARAAVAMALQIYDGDPARIRSILGDNDVTNVSLAAALVSQNRFDDGLDAWNRVSSDAKANSFKATGESLINSFVGARRLSGAARIAADLQPDASEKPAIGQVVNGGFESGVKVRNAGLFDWKIADGVEPQIGLSEGQKRSGKYSLMVQFNSSDPAAFRPISELVAVVAGHEYELTGYYRSDVKTSAALKWDVADAGVNTTFGSSQPLVPAVDWARFSVRFRVPAEVDGIMIRFVREGCGALSCPTAGKIFFDDLAIKGL